MNLHIGCPRDVPNEHQEYAPDYTIDYSYGTTPTDLSGNYYSGGSGDEDDAAGEGVTNVFIGVKPQANPAPTNPPASDTTTTTLQGEDTGDTVAESTTIKLDVISNPPKIYSMLCTVSAERDFKNPPPDGLCDFTFFDSLYHPTVIKHTVLTRPPGGTLRDLLDVARSASKTQYGVSINTLRIPDFEENFKEAKGKEWIQKHLFSSNTYHWGVLNINQFDVEVGFLKTALKALQALAEFSQPSATKLVSSYTFVGMYGPPPSGCNQISGDIKSGFMPDMFVVLGHLSYDDNVDNRGAGLTYACRIFPPNIYYIPDDVRKGLTYGHTFYEACQLAGCLQNDQTFQVPIAVSFTLKGRWYKAETPDPQVPTIGNYDLLKPCALGTYSQGAYVLQVCGDRRVNYTQNLAFNDALQTGYTFDKGSNGSHTLTFDNSKSYRKKLCDAKFNLTNVKFSIAAYDINYDSGTSKCPTSVIVGNYGRTSVIRKLVNFLGRYTDPQKHGDCLKVQ